LLFFSAGWKDYRATMKRIFVLSTLLCAAIGARADLVIQQQITAPNYTGVTTMMVKGTRVRLDLYAGEPKALSTIVDLSTGETITLLHTQKMYLKTQTKPAKPAGTASKAPVPRAAGKTQKVGNYDTEVYNWSNDRGIAGTAWVAKNYPDFARIKVDLATLDRTAGAENDTSPEVGLLPGMVVRSQVSGGGQTLTLALISARETPLDASSFGIPRDYQEMPKLKPPIKSATSPPAAQKPPGSSTPKAPVAPSKTSTQLPPGW
jgi:hypothetical protein